MSENKTVKYHIPEQGIYLYARNNAGKTELTILNSTDKEQVLPYQHYSALTKDTKVGKNTATGKKIDFTKNLILSANQSLIIEF